MGKGAGIVLMVFGFVVYFLGATILSQYLTISENIIRGIAGVVFVIGAFVAFFSRPKYPRY